jgi:hypothetical protein
MPRRVQDMKHLEVFESVPGILRPFKTFIEEQKLADTDQIVYYGVPGTCTPFVELLAFAVRSLPCEQVFVPVIDTAKARLLTQVPSVGMQVAAAPSRIAPRVAVLMGGLAMPNAGVTARQVSDAVLPHGASLVGICFMSMFKKGGWLDTFDFDLLIDATIAPVNVWKEQ